MNRYWYIGQHKAYGYWKDDVLSTGQQVRIWASKEEAALINGSCKADYRWVMQSGQVRSNKASQG